MLKVDSSKVVVKMLHKAVANTASWATDIGNERGEACYHLLGRYFIFAKDGRLFGRQIQSGRTTTISSSLHGL